MLSILSVFVGLVIVIFYAMREDLTPNWTMAFIGVMLIFCGLL